MSIEIGSKWVNILEKDMEVVEIVFYDFICPKNESFSPWAVGFKSKNDYGVLALKDFIRQYKPYEIVYEYQYTYFHTSNNEMITTVGFYTDDEGLKEWRRYKHQRLDFTKRERT